MKPITRIEVEAAQQWRLDNDLTLQELADLTGFSVSSLVWMERGQSPTSNRKGKRKVAAKPVNPRAWRRYRLLCELVTLRRHVPGWEFDWK